MGLFSFLNKGSKDAILTDGERDTLISVLSTVERLFRNQKDRRGAEQDPC